MRQSLEFYALKIFQAANSYDVLGAIKLILLVCNRGAFKAFDDFFEHFPAHANMMWFLLLDRIEKNISHFWDKFEPRNYILRAAEILDIKSTLQFSLALTWDVCRIKRNILIRLGFRINLMRIQRQFVALLWKLTESFGSSCTWTYMIRQWILWKTILVSKSGNYAAHDVAMEN